MLLKKNVLFLIWLSSYELGEMLKNKKWEFDSENFKVNIKDPKDNDALLMTINIVKNNDQFLFLLSESPFILEVEKL